MAADGLLRRRGNLTSFQFERSENYYILGALQQFAIADCEKCVIDMRNLKIWGQSQMLKIFRQMKTASSPLPIAIILFLAFVTVSTAQERQYGKEAWSFGVIGDTQWTPSKGDPAGTNPGFVSLTVINQINSQFIQKKVKFVIQMGDGENFMSNGGIIVRAAAAQALYVAGIGFFPMRGNHEQYFTAKPEPADFLLPALRDAFPQTRGLANTFRAGNFSSPTGVSADLDGMSYSFDYGPSGSNARFVILDVLGMPTADNMDNRSHIRFGYPVQAQQNWINQRLDRSTTHAFVLSHQPLIAESHADNPFGGLVYEKASEQNVFISGLQAAGVRYYIGAHDHLYQRSVISSPDTRSKVEELIAAPVCPKFYAPISDTDSKWQGYKPQHELSVSQEIYNIGFYIYTVDGPRVNVDYYSDKDGHYMSDNSWPRGPANEGSLITPTFTFVKKESWGYSLNGHEFLVAQGEPYTIVADSFGTTAARILSGFNRSTAVDFDGRHFTKKISTGWSPRNSDNLRSDILSLWGMADLGTVQADTYVLSLKSELGGKVNLMKGTIGIATVDSQGNWVNAVNKNFGGTKKFVVGPYKPQYGLGTYGVDPATRTAWAVLNYNADFAVADDIEPKGK